jgi:hypothetical protein
VGIKSQRKDWTGQRFGRLVAVSFVGRRRHNAVWLFRRDCGSEHGASISNVARQDRPIRSCGCLYCEVAGKHVGTHGHAGLRTRTYKSWEAMKRRCIKSRH